MMLCSTGLPSDVIIEIGDTSFHLHKFPLISRSKELERFMKDLPSDNEKSILELHDLPGGAKAFLLIARFCYGVKMELTSSNVVPLRCAAEHLQMSEDYGEGNLIIQTENFLNHIFGYWSDTLKALKTCEEVLPLAEELHITSRCIHSLVIKAADPTLAILPLSGSNSVQSPEDSEMWNGISMSLTSKETGEDWWFEDVSSLSLPLYKRFMQAMALYASSSCCASLEKRIGFQLDEADLEDLLIPNIGYSMETIHDIDCVQRMLDHFMIVDHDDVDSTCNDIVVEEERRIVANCQRSSPMTKVADLIDSYLAEVAPDVNLKLPKFQSLAAVIPDCARTLDDGIYRAIDIYLKSHAWMTESEKEQICRLMNCQKLSLEASTHAAQNERLPLRAVVQVLFFEQLKLRTSVAGWFFASDTLENPTNMSGNLALLRNDGNTTHNNPVVAFDHMKEKVAELEKECLSMKQDMEKMMKSKGSWNMLLKKLGCRLIPRPSNPKVSKLCRKSKIAPASATELEENAVAVNS
ncbi:hypothetical protein TSUD_40840 [Trifolium subterraneum]|nr:hypothetical protein TSUD_40840 [Trifolium subterraneum]